jgi:hypothetical protein
MRNTLFLLLFSLVLLSCDKDSGSDDTSPVGTKPAFWFNANGRFYEWNYAYQQTPTKSVVLAKNSSGEYSLSAVSDTDHLHLGIPAKLLLEKAYTYTHGGPVASGFTQARLFDIDSVNTYTTATTGDAVTVQITRINNDMASGTFQARLSVAGNSSKKLEITNGVFFNIRILE